MPDSAPPLVDSAAGRASEPPPSLAPLRWAKPPRQARSQRTLERLLDAAEELIMERGSTGLTVSEVVRVAGSSVGAFYARFPDKDALLATLHERACVEALATTDLALDPARWTRADVGRVILELVKFVDSTCRERMGLLLAFIAMAATDSAYAEWCRNHGIHDPQPGAASKKPPQSVGSSHHASERLDSLIRRRGIQRHRLLFVSRRVTRTATAPV